MESIPEFAELLAEARSGDERAAGVVFAAHQPMLLRYLRARERVGADELASEVWLLVARGLMDFHGDAQDFRAWLFSIARSRVADHRRRETRRIIDPGAVAQAGTDGEAQVADVDNRVAAQDAVDLMVKHLSQDEAEVLILRVVADLDAARTAELMGRPESWVRATQHRALQRLDQQLGPDSEISN